MTFLVERLSELRKLFSLLTVCQLVIDIASELSARRGLAFDDYTQAVRNLDRLDLVDDATLAELGAMPGFRNVLVHEYVTLSERPRHRVIASTAFVPASPIAPRCRSSFATRCEPNGAPWQ